MKDVLLIFGLLIVGIVIARMGIRKSVKPPKGGRYFKKKIDK